MSLASTMATAQPKRAASWRATRSGFAGARLAWVLEGGIV